MSVTITSDTNTVDITTHDGTQTITARGHTFHLPSGRTFKLFVDDQEHDHITEAISALAYTFPVEYGILEPLFTPGAHLLDLGSHIGTFSMVAASIGYHVTAVDASPRNIALVQASAAHNGYPIQTVWSAISDHCGTLEFIQAGPYGLIANDALDNPRITVPCTTVDALLAERGQAKVDVVKMDIEGAELLALAGMSALLSREHAPVFIFESNGHTLNYQNETPTSLLRTFEAYGYTLYLIGDHELIRSSADDLQVAVCMDFLATKQPPPGLAGWTTRAPLRDDEIIHALQADLFRHTQHEREYLCRAIPQARASLRAHPAMENILRYLHLDQAVYAELCALHAQVEAQAHEINRLQALVHGYENGRIMRALAAIKGWLSKLQ